MKRKAFIAILLLFMSIVYSARGATHQLIGANVLDVGNEWHYTTTYTMEDNAPVNYSVTEVERVTGTTTVGSYTAKIVSLTESGETSYEYLYIDSNYMLYLGYDDNIDGMSFHVEYANNNPLEIYPVWIDESYSNYHFGNGDFTLSVPEIPATWTETHDVRITFLRTESVTVPAGTFDCVVVFIRVDIDDSLGIDGYMEETLYMCPEVGPVKSENYTSVRDPSDGIYYVTEYTDELTWTNIPSSIAKDKSSIDFGDISTSQMFQVWNDGPGTLNYNVSISEGGSYFSVLPLSGISIGSSDKNTHTISVDRGSIELGATVTGEVTISSAQADDSPQVIQLSAMGDSLPDPTILISDPNGGEILMAGIIYPISWSNTGLVSNVSIEYSDANGIDGTWTIVEASTPNDGEYEWTVPGVNSEQCLVRVSDASNADFFDVSDDVFTIYQCQIDPAADLNNDCKANMYDLAIASAGWDDVYNISNLSALANDWLGNGNPFDPEYTEPLPIMWVYIDDPGVDDTPSGGDVHEPFNGYMSKYETTNAQYCQFLNAALASGDITVGVDNVIYGADGLNSGTDFIGKAYYDLTGSGSTTDGATNGGAARINYIGGSFTVDDDFNDHTVTYVSWYGATAFCNYYGYRLPTEWEWQAVADYDGTYIYGCGLSINNGIANYLGSTHPDGTTVVGSFGTYGYGMCDMAGNVIEWTSTVVGDISIARDGGWFLDQYGCAFTAVTTAFHYTMQYFVGFRVCR